MNLSGTTRLVDTNFPSARPHHQRNINRIMNREFLDIDKSHTPILSMRRNRQLKIQDDGFVDWSLLDNSRNPCVSGFNLHNECDYNVDGWLH